MCILVGLSANLRVDLVEALVSESYSDGQFIVRQGEEGDKLYVLQSGIVQVQVSTGQGESATTVKTLER